jgi:proteasome lid subunit RPN8/RPN11
MNNKQTRMHTHAICIGVVRAETNARVARVYVRVSRESHTPRLLPRVLAYKKHTKRGAGEQVSIVTHPVCRAEPSLTIAFTRDYCRKMKRRPA